MTPCWRQPAATRLAFVRGLDLVIIDEVQSAPELLRAIKQSVDSDRRAGRFLLTGSANILTLPQVLKVVYLSYGRAN